MRTLIVILILVLAALSGCGDTNPRFFVETELGNIEVELYVDKAPVTADNFLRYINENRLEGATFYRSVTMDNQPDNDVKIQVIQGGLKDENHPQALPPIEHETTEQTGILHLDGTISMARWGPGTATGEFFICVGKQPGLDFGGKRNPDGQGFAAFGRVVSGMDVVKKIHGQPVEGQWLTPEIKITTVTIRK
jgi:peptidyl-prolyl cis-trans isomerase A (cyclophilin A)